MRWKSNNLKELRDQYVVMLSEVYGEAESKQLVHILTEHLFGVTPVRIALKPEKRLSESEILQFHQAVKELLKHKPVQYITGHTTFLDLKLAVNESVLIPRPETEELVQLIVEHEKNKQVRLIDIGTGSGCIALTLKKNLPKALVAAADISAEALRITVQNAQKHHLEIDLIRMDVLNPDSYAALPVYDVIVSNPPYVTQSDKKLMQKNVLEYEPETALFVEDENPLIFYKAILEFNRLHLANKGRVYFEINEHKGPEVARLLKEYKYTKINIHHDMHGKERLVEAKKA